MKTGIFLLCMLCSVTGHFALADNEIAYRFTDTDPTDDEEDEYFDAYGKRIYDYEYREKQAQQAKHMQDAASKPFGKAGTKFGNSWGTAPLKPKASPSPKQEVSEEEEKEAEASPSPSPKSRVLVA